MTTFEEIKDTLWLYTTNENHERTLDEAYAALKVDGDLVVDGLIWALRQEDVALKLLALQLLQHFYTYAQRAIPAIRSCIADDEHRLVQIMAINTIHHMGDTSDELVSLLSPKLESEDAFERIVSAGNLWRICRSEDAYVVLRREAAGDEEPMPIIAKDFLDELECPIRPEAAVEVDCWPIEKQRAYCDSILKEFASLPRYRGRTPDVAAMLLRFGDVGLRAILDGVHDNDFEVRILSITCVSELLIHFQEWIIEIADLLDHWDTKISVFVPRILWRSKAVIAIPKLEASLQHDHQGLVALSAKSIAIIDPSRREESLKVVEGLELGEFFKANLLAELRREKPYVGL
jgi:hypothetical protein